MEPVVEPQSADFLEYVDRHVQEIRRLAGKAPSGREIVLEGLLQTLTLLRKNIDYGNSALRVPMLAPNLTALQALLCRMSDKVCRIGQLAGSGEQQVKDESLLDTLRDLGAYCVLAAIEVQNRSL